jgi:hypothetical protein
MVRRTGKSFRISVKRRSGLTAHGPGAPVD